MATESSKHETPYIGSRISLVSRLQVRYEGTLYSVDTKESTIALAKVQCFGTENRKATNQVEPLDRVFEYIIFKASDIQDLMVCETPRPAPALLHGLPADPAILSVSDQSKADNYGTNQRQSSNLGPQTTGRFHSQQKRGHDYAEQDQKSRAVQTQGRQPGRSFRQSDSGGGQSRSFVNRQTRPANARPNAGAPLQSRTDDRRGTNRSLGVGAGFSNDVRRAGATPANAEFAGGFQNKGRYEQNQRGSGTQPRGGGDTGGGRMMRDDNSRGLQQQRLNQGQGSHPVRKQQAPSMGGFTNATFGGGRPAGDERGARMERQDRFGGVRGKGQYGQPPQQGPRPYRRFLVHFPPRQGRLQPRFTNDYDFEKANKDFENVLKNVVLDDKEKDSDKSGETLTEDKPEGGEKQLELVEGAEDGDKKEPSAKIEEVKVAAGSVGEKEEGELEESVNDDDAETGQIDIKGFYDRNISFFDKISCDLSKENQDSKTSTIDWRQQWQTNTETFGPNAVREYRLRRTFIENRRRQQLLRRQQDTKREKAEGEELEAEPKEVERKEAVEEVKELVGGDGGDDASADVDANNDVVSLEVVVQKDEAVDISVEAK